MRRLVWLRAPMNFMSIRAMRAGLESFVAEDIGAALKAVRAGVPGVPVGISTREGIMADPAARQRAF